MADVFHVAESVSGLTEFVFHETKLKIHDTVDEFRDAEYKDRRARHDTNFFKGRNSNMTKTFSHLNRGGCAAALLALLGVPFAANAQNNYRLARVIGNPAGRMLNNALGAAIDSGGNLYIADAFNSRIVKFDSSGKFIQTIGSYGKGNGQFQNCYGVAVDKSGNIYGTDTSGGRIEKFDHNGNYLKQFGSPGSGNGQFRSPYRIAIDSLGNICVVEGANRFQKLDSNGNFLLGIGSGYNGAPGAVGTFGKGNGQFLNPVGLALDSANNIYIGDAGNNRIQKFNSSGAFLLGIGAGYNGVPGAIGSSGTGSGQFNFPHDVFVDGSGAIYVGDENNNRVQKFSASGGFLFGIGAGYNGVPGAVGSGGTSNGQFSSPAGTVVDGSGNIFVVDTNNKRVEKFNSSGGYLSQFGNPLAGNGQLSAPAGLALNGGTLYVADAGDNTVQLFDTTGKYQFQFGGVGSGSGLFSNGPYGIALDSNGYVFAADRSPGSIQQFDGLGGFINQFSIFNNDLTIGTNGVIYVSDSSNAIQVLNPSGDVILAFGGSGSGDGKFNNPYGVAVDSSGNIFVADSGNNRIEKFNSGSAYVSQFGAAGAGNGQFNDPRSLAIDSAGNLYVADYGNNRVQKFDKNGVFLSVIGSSADYATPGGVTVDSSGAVYISDTSGGFVVVYLPDNGSVSGVITFEGIAPTAAPQNVVFTFRSNDGSPDITQSLPVPASGVFTLTGLFNKAGILHIKSDKYLAVNVPVNLSAGNVTGLTAFQAAGDANNDNSVDTTDFGILVGAYNSDSSVSGSGYDPTTDFNGDGVVDTTDFGLLVGEYNNVGAI